MATPVFPSMVPGPGDGIQPLLVKACYWLEAAAEALGGTDATMPFPSMVPGAQDGLQPLLVKIAYWSEQIDSNIGGGGGGGSGVLTLYDNVAALPAAPANPAVVNFATFRDGSAGQTWDPVNLAWI